MIDEEYLDGFISRAIAEDVGPGDHSSNCSIPDTANGKMQLLVKEHGILAGVDVAKRIFEKVDPAIEVNLLLKDGDLIRAGDIAFTIEGPIRGMLRGERLALNLMQRMSGIATVTHSYVSIGFCRRCKTGY